MRRLDTKEDYESVLRTALSNVLRVIHDDHRRSEGLSFEYDRGNPHRVISTETFNKYSSDWLRKQDMSREQALGILHFSDGSVYDPAEAVRAVGIPTEQGRYEVDPKAVSGRLAVMVFASDVRKMAKELSLGQLKRAIEEGKQPY